MGFKKRLAAPKHYPIERKKNSYVVQIKGSRSDKDAIPTVLFLRDVLGHAESVSEAKEIVKDGKVKRNGDTIGDVKQGLGSLDLVEVEGLDENYRLVKTAKGMDFIPTDDTRSVAKITGKRVEGDRYIYSLHNGENYSTDEEYTVQNTLIFDGDIEEVPLEEGQTVLVTDGQHAGETAELLEKNLRGMNASTATVEADQEFETRLDNIVAVGDVEVNSR